MDPERSQLSPFDPARAGRSPLCATAWTRAPALVASGVLVALLSLVGLVVSGVDPLALAPSTSGGTILYRSPLDDIKLLAELALLCGFAVTGTLMLAYTVRDDSRVRVRFAPRAFSLAVGGGLSGFFLGRTVLLETLFDAVTRGSGTALLDPYWVAEIGLFFPIAVGLGAATAPLLVGLSRCGALSPRLGGRTRGFAVLWALIFAAGWSPPDPATFVLFAAPPLCGLAVAVAWLEF